MRKKSKNSKKALRNARLARKRKRAVVYIRFSSHMQMNSFSIEYQKEQTMKYVEKMGYEFVDFYIDEAKTGKEVAGRESFIKMLEHSEDDIYDVIVVFSFSRAFRNTREALNLNHELYTGLGIIVEGIIERIDMTSAHGKFSATNLFAMHELSSEITAEHVRAGMYYALQQGYHMSGRAPYGYDIVGTGEYSSKGKERKKLVINEREAAIVREMFDLHISGLTFSEIAREFHSRGETFSNGKTFNYEQISYIIKNKRYCGFAEYEFKGYDKLIVDTGIPIVSEETWQKSIDVLERRMSHNMKNRVSNNRNIYSATGILKCGKCGKHYHGTGRKKLSYYRCKGRSHGDCRNFNYRKEVLENTVTRAIFDNILTDEKIDFIAEYISNQVKDMPKKRTVNVAELKTRKKKLTDELKNLVRQQLNDKISQNVLDELSEDLNAELEEVEKALSHADKETKHDYSKKSIKNYIIGIKNGNTVNADLYNKMLADAFVEKIIAKEDTLKITLRVLPFGAYSYKKGNESPFPLLYEITVIYHIA